MAPQARASSDEDDEPPLRCVRPDPSSWERYGGAIVAIERMLFPPDLTDSPDDIRATFEAPEAIFICAFLGDELVGFVSGELARYYVEPEDPEYDPAFDSPQTIYVESIDVRPDRQGRGIGKALLRCFIEEARSRGFTRLVGHWRAGASAALVKKFGGETRHVDHDYNGTGETYEYVVLKL